METKSYSFKELLSVIIDNRGKTCPISDEGLPLIATNCIKMDSIYPVFEKVRHVSQETYEEWFRGHPEPGDIIFVCKGSPGRVALTPDPVNFCIAQDMLAIRGDNNIIDQKFLFAMLRSRVAQGKIMNMHVGTLIPHFKKGDFTNLYFDVPIRRAIQKCIGEIYYTFSRKIELNRKMNETLEAMAQAMFKSWFVDFDPVLDNALAKGNEIPEELMEKAERRKAVLESGKYKPLPKDIKALFPSSFEFNDELGKWIPEGWGVSKLEDHVQVKYGKDHKKLGEGKYPCYGSGGIMRYVEHALCESESVLIPRKGSLNNMMYVREPFWSVDTMFFTLFRKPNMVKFLFYYLKKFNFVDMNVGSAVPSMTTKVLNNIDLLIPSEKLLEKFEVQVELIVNRKKSNVNQNEVIRNQRDILLSQLISGKTRLPESFIQQFESQTESVVQ